MSNSNYNPDRAHYRVITWNVNGLLDKFTCSVVLKTAKLYYPQILLLQETHIMGHRCPLLTSYGYGRVYHAGFTGRSCGVAILLHNHFHIIHTQT